MEATKTDSSVALTVVSVPTVMTARNADIHIHTDIIV